MDKKQMGKWRKMPAAWLMILLLMGCSSSPEDREAFEADGSVSEAETESSIEENEEETEEENAEEMQEEETEKEDLEEETQETDLEEAQEAGNAVLHPVLEKEWSSVYAEGSSNLLCEGGFSRIVLRDPGYEELKASLTSYNEEKNRIVEDEMARMEQEARALMAGSPYPPAGFSVGYTAQIERADDRIFSFMEQSSIYTGGAHGSETITGYAYDSQTGERLELSDVVSDMDGLYEYLIRFLRADPFYRENLYEEWEDTVGKKVYQETEGGYTYSLQWALAEDGIKIYFSPDEIGPSVMGPVTVRIHYDEELLGVAPQYFPVKEKSVWKLGAYEELAMDVDQDGMIESVSYRNTSGQNGIDQIYTVNVDGQAVEINCTYGITNAYVMKNGQGKAYFYADCQSDNDYHYLNIIDLTELKESGENTNAPTFSHAFYDDVPVDASSFALSSRGDLFSTVPVSRQYYVGEDGKPQTDESEYTVDRLEVTALQDVPALTGSSFEKEAVVPAGTKLYVISSDEASYVTAETEEGAKYRFEVNGEQWPHTIDGTDITELFDGLIFAG